MDGADPDFAVKAEHIKTVAGASIKLAGTVKDADGIKDIRLECKEIGLNKIIDIISIYGEPLKEYELDFSYKIQQDVQGDSFNVDIYIDDVAGKTTKKTVLVTLDADFTAPVFTAAWSTLSWRRDMISPPWLPPSRPIPILPRTRRT